MDTEGLKSILDSSLDKSYVKGYTLISSEGKVVVSTIVNTSWMPGTIGMYPSIKEAANEFSKSPLSYFTVGFGENMYFIIEITPGYFIVLDIPADKCQEILTTLLKILPKLSEKTG